jgi:nucleoside 2-deoxyribosyltransferase
MAKVFFGCSMRGGYGLLSRQELAMIPQIIEELGHEVTSRHQTKQGIIAEEDRLNPTDIHDRDFQWLKDSDAGIFEITNSSIGTGEEISDLVGLGKPVLCLYKKELENKISAYGRGKKGSRFVHTVFDCFGYESLDDAKNRIREFLKENEQASS